MQKREIIATLIKAGRFDLANAFAYEATAKGYWKNLYLDLKGDLDDLAGNMDTWAKGVEGTLGTKDPAYKRFLNAAKDVRKLVKDLGFMREFTLRTEGPQQPAPTPRPIQVPPMPQDIQWQIEQVQRVPPKIPGDRKIWDKIREQLKKITPELDQPTQKSLRGPLYPLFSSAGMDHDHAYAIVREALRTELDEPVARRHLLSWFRGTAWADLYRPRAFEQAVDSLVRSERLKRVGGKLLLVG